MMANAEGMDAIVIFNGEEPFLDSTFWYLTEQTSGLFEYSFAIVSKNGKLDVIVSPLEAEAAKNGKGKVFVFKNAKERDKKIAKLLEGKKKIGVNTGKIVLSGTSYLKKLNKGIKIIDATAAINETVSLKSPKEVKLTKKACSITSKVAQKIPSMVEKGMTEKELASEMDYQMRKLGATGMAFDTIVAFGKNAADTHHTPTDAKLKTGDVILCDFGCKYQMYSSDLTRTMFFGEPNPKLKRAYEVVLKAQKAGIKEIRAGANASEPDLAARKIIDSTEFKNLFIHSFGHGIGMDVHQYISVSPKSKQVLKAGNIISAEPGVYISGLGGVRIEDTVLVTEKGCRKLTSYDHSYTVI